MALALVLLVACGLMVRGFWKLQEVHIGLNPENAVTMSLALPQTTYPKDEMIESFWTRLEDRNKAFDECVIHVGGPQGRQSGGNGSRAHTCEAGHTIFEAGPKTLDHFVFWISGWRKSQTHGDCVFGIQPDVDFL